MKKYCNIRYGRLTALILFLLGVQQSKAQNLLDLNGWTVGQGNTGVFSAIGQATENIREWGEGPNGSRVVVWKAVPEGASNDDGGWNSAPVAINHTKMYRFAVWIKKTNSNDGHTYFGCGPTLNLGNSLDNNPYFWYGDLPELNKWYLLVGYIHGSGDPSTTNYSAIYDGSTGAKVIAATDFKFAVGASSTYHRSYLFYDPNINDRQYFYGPRVEEVNGNEPSVQTLFGLIATNSAGNTLLSGNVGIGTSAPNAKLEVLGTTILSGHHANVDSRGLGGNLSYLANTGKLTIGWNRSQGDGETDFISNQGNGGSGGFAFYNYDNANTETQLVRISGNGYVGIGTASPKEKLSVNGKVRAHEIKVETQNWPDYVFTKEHKLPSLAEVEKFIKTNNHLPEIPSAKEAEAEGISLGEMNAKLLKKIEELTLYMIEQGKQIEQLKEDNRKQQQVIDKL